MLKDENKYISAKETARMLGVQTNTLRMWRWRGSGFYIPYRKNDKGRYEYSLGWVNYFKYNFKKPERGKRPYQLKHTTIDNHGLRLMVINVTVTAFAVLLFVVKNPVFLISIAYHLASLLVHQVKCLKL
tara:strand:- start:330 stop:716 length:387 start_codon:yes stop_codon:yes gene_type:complete